MTAINHALLKVDRKPPSLPLYQYLDFVNTVEGYLWGEAAITGISGKSNGSAVLAFPDLTGVTITSYGSTGGAIPVLVGNTITFPSGSFWDIQLSDGTFIPDPNSGYNTAGTGVHATPSNFTEDIDAPGSLYFNTYGYTRDGAAKMVPADQTNPGFDVLGNPITFLAISGGLNLADGIIDYSILVESDLFNKDALQGNVLGLPEVWLTGTVWDFSTAPLKWKPEERAMEYLYSRLTEEYKKIIFTTMNMTGETFTGIEKEEVFTEPLSDEDAEILNLKNNGTNTIP